MVVVVVGRRRRRRRIPLGYLRMVMIMRRRRMVEDVEVLSVAARHTIAVIFRDTKRQMHTSDERVSSMGSHSEQNPNPTTPHDNNPNNDHNHPTKNGSTEE